MIYQLNRVFAKFCHFFKKIFTLKSVDPKLGTGFIGTLIVSIGFLIQMITKVPLVTKYSWPFAIIIITVLLFFIKPRFEKTYDPKNNSNRKVFIFLILFIIIIGTIVTAVGLTKWR